MTQRQLSALPAVELVARGRHYTIHLDGDQVEACPTFQIARMALRDWQAYARQGGK